MHIFVTGNGLKLKIKLDGSGDGNNFEVVQYEESGTGQLADELSNHSSTATNSVAGENTRDHNLEQVIIFNSFRKLFSTILNHGAILGLVKYIKQGRTTCGLRLAKHFSTTDY